MIYVDPWIPKAHCLECHLELLCHEAVQGHRERDLCPKVGSMEVW